VTLPADLARTNACIPVEDFERQLSDQQRAHLDSCARCQTEWQLWQEFSESTPASDEGAAVQWIVAELGRRAAGKPQGAPAASSRFAFWRAMVGVAAVAAVALVVGYGLLDRAPTVRDLPSGQPVYRADGLTLVAPVGDIAIAPAELEWAPVASAVRYDVELLEVDRTVVWRATSSSPRVALPVSVVEQIVPGKTLLWNVAAIDSSGRPLMSSGARSFRVLINAPQRTR
jgi:hypothetical protein